MSRILILILILISFFIDIVSDLIGIVRNVCNVIRIMKSNTKLGLQRIKLQHRMEIHTIYCLIKMMNDG